MSAGWWGGYLDGRPVITAAMAAGASQDPWELGRALDAVAAVDPLRSVLEIGCDQGGTLLAWRSVCKLVLGITTADNGYESGGSGNPLVAHGAVVRMADSHSAASPPWVVERLVEAGLAELDVLVIDGDHRPEGVLDDLRMYGPLVRAGGLILLHDITPSQDPRSQVWQVWQGLAAAYCTEEIANPDGGFGWGVITRREGDRF